MSRESSFWCRSFPRLWSWLIALLGLPLLYFLMIQNHQKPIENDLAARVGGDLSKTEMGLAGLDVGVQGRDVLLNGRLPGEEERDLALKLAGDVDGVRRVDFLGALGPLAAPELAATNDNGKLVLEGKVATAEQVESLVQAAVAKVGDGNVDNRLQVDDGVAEADWLPSVGGLTGALPVGAALKLGAEQLMLSGEADSDAEIDQLGEMAKQAISGSELQLANNLQLSAKAREAIEAAARKAAEEEARKQAEAEAANKAAEEEEARKQVEAEAAKKAAAEEEARKQAEAEAAKKAAAEEEARKQAEAEAAKKAAEEEARKQAEAEAAKKAAAEEDARKQAEAEAEAAKKAAVEEEARKQAEAEAAKKAAAEEEARKQAEAAQQACQNKLNSAMTGKKILFATNKADINPESYPLLNNLADIVNECSAGLVGRRIVVGGHTDNSGASDYNQSLSQRRAEAVVSYLQGKNISTGLLESRGFGETQPAATNDTEEGKAQNRRITFEIKQK